MEKTRRWQAAIPSAILCIILLSSPAFSQSDSLKETRSLVRNVICLLFWLIPIILGVSFIVGSALIITGTAEHRDLGKKMVLGSLTAFIILLVLMAVASMTIPGVDVRICFGAIPLIENQPPIAEARVSYATNPSEKRTEITLGDSAFFDASLSIDPDGTIAEYMWDFGDGSTGQGVRTSHVYGSLGDYFVSLRVADDRGAISLLPSTVRVIVNPPLSAKGSLTPPGATRPTPTTLQVSPTGMPVTTYTTTTTTTTTSTTSTAPKPSFKIVFVQLNQNFANFKAKAEADKNTWVRITPLSKCPDKVVAIAPEDKICYVQDSGQLDQVKPQAARQCAIDWGYADYTRVVGVVNSIQGAWGYETGGIVIIQYAAFGGVTVPHELGHTFDLCDEGYGNELNSGCSSGLCGCGWLNCQCPGGCVCCPNKPEQSSIMCSSNLCSRACSFGMQFASTSYAHLDKVLTPYCN